MEPLARLTPRRRPRVSRKLDVLNSRWLPIGVLETHQRPEEYAPPPKFQALRALWRHDEFDTRGTAP